MATIEERVAAGAAFLDENVPDWHERIKPEALSLVSCDACVLGQLFGHYEKGCEALGIGAWSAQPNHERAVDLGFSDAYNCWNDLTAAWRAELAKPWTTKKA